MFYVKFVLVLLWCALASTIGVFLCVARWGNLDNNRALGTMFYFGVRRITGIEVVVEGLEHLDEHRPCIFIANHQSGFDVPFFGSNVPRRTVIIGKKELKWVPFFGILFAAAGNVSIDRGNRTQAFSGLEAVTRAIREKGASVFIFPEGTRNRAGEGLLPFKKGAFYVAIEAQVPLVPLIMQPIRNIANWKNRALGPATLKLKALPPISTAGLTKDQVGELAVRARELMLAAQKEWTV